MKINENHSILDLEIIENDKKKIFDTMRNIFIHGSFFRARVGATKMSIGDRLKLMPYECLVGLSMTVVSTVIWGIIM